MHLSCLIRQHDMDEEKVKRSTPRSVLALDASQVTAPVQTLERH